MKISVRPFIPEENFEFFFCKGYFYLVVKMGDELKFVTLEGQEKDSDSFNFSLKERFKVQFEEKTGEAFGDFQKQIFYLDDFNFTHNLFLKKNHEFSDFEFHFFSYFDHYSENLSFKVEKVNKKNKDDKLNKKMFFCFEILQNKNPKEVFGGILTLFEKEILFFSEEFGFFSFFEKENESSLKFFEKFEKMEKIIKFKISKKDEDSLEIEGIEFKRLKFFEGEEINEEGNLKIEQCSKLNSEVIFLGDFHMNIFNYHEMTESFLKVLEEIQKKFQNDNFKNMLKVIMGDVTKEGNFLSYYLLIILIFSNKNVLNLNSLVFITGNHDVLYPLDYKEWGKRDSKNSRAFYSNLSTKKFEDEGIRIVKLKEKKKITKIILLDSCYTPNDHFVHRNCGGQFKDKSLIKKISDLCNDEKDLKDEKEQLIICLHHHIPLSLPFSWSKANGCFDGNYLLESIIKKECINSKEVFIVNAHTHMDNFRKNYHNVKLFNLNQLSSKTFAYFSHKNGIEFF